jgi:dTDP-4-amino-4,6-dideoxygalactose transaminase
VDSLSRLAKENDCFLLFDAAHALGSRMDGRAVGTFGDAEVFSLSGTKLVTSAEGGLISTRHNWLAERIVYYRAYGFQHDYNSKYVGLNGKISELHSALGTLGLKQIEQLLEKRHWIVNYYKEKLGSRVKWQNVRSNVRSTYKDISIGVGSMRARIERSLHDDAIQTKRYFLPLHHMKPYQEYAAEAYPVAEYIYETTLCIPAYSDLDEKDLDRISNRILLALDSES